MPATADDTDGTFDDGPSESSAAPALGLGDRPGGGVGTRGRSVREFLTDGSLSALCAQMSTMLSTRVELRDERGDLIESLRHSARSAVDKDRTHPWHIVAHAPLPDPARKLPIVVAGREIGVILIEAGEIEVGLLDQVEAAMGFVVSAAAELCEQELNLWRRMDQIELMYRLSAALVRHEPLDSVLTQALDAAIEVLGLDAGSVVLLPENAGGVPVRDNEAELVLRASRGLSRAWLESPLPLSREREFDRLLLGGEVIAVEDLWSDPRILIPDRAREEGLRSFIGAGLITQGRTWGLMRVYSRTPRRFTLAEQRILKSLAEQSAMAVQQSFMERMQRRERQMQRQLALAASVQRRMLPQAKPDVAGFDIAARYEPSSHVGGDFWDSFNRRNDRLAVTVGDVVGHGIAASLLMSSVRSALRAFAAGFKDVHEVMGRVNRSMCRDTLESEFATIWLGEIDPETRELRHCSAGHEPPILIPWQKDEGRPGEPRELERGGLVAGIDRGEVYHSARTELSPGDVLVVYTDGLTEAASFAGENFGRRRLANEAVEFLTREPDAPAELLVDHLLWAVRRFVGLQRQRDDQTLLVIRVARDD